MEQRISDYFVQHLVRDPPPQVGHNPAGSECCEMRRTVRVTENPMSTPRMRSGEGGRRAEHTAQF